MQKFTYGDAAKTSYKLLQKSTVIIQIRLEALAARVESRRLRQQFNHS